MNAIAPLAAQILESSAAGFAAAANAELQQRRPQGGASDSLAWQQHLQQRVLELAAAVRIGEPGLFASRIAWLRRAAAARKADDSEILLALESLHAALQTELPESVAAGVSAIVEAAIDDSRRPVEAEQSAIDPQTRAGRLALDYIAACLDSGATDPVELIMSSLDQGMSPRDVYCDVLLAAQKEVGQLWHSGDFSVTEERLVTETTRRLMSLIAQRFKPAKITGPTVLAASVAGNAHDIGLRMVTDLFTLDGWRCVYLGANVPTAEIADAVSAFDVDLALLTATLTPQLNAMTNAVKAVREASPRTRILVGGIAFDESDSVWRAVGADGFSDRIDRAVEIGRSLVEAAKKREP